MCPAEPSVRPPRPSALPLQCVQPLSPTHPVFSADTPRCCPLPRSFPAAPHSVRPTDRPPGRRTPPLRGLGQSTEPPADGEEQTHTVGLALREKGNPMGSSEHGAGHTVGTQSRWLSSWPARPWSARPIPSPGQGVPQLRVLLSGWTPAPPAPLRRGASQPPSPASRQDRARRSVRSRSRSHAAFVPGSPASLATRASWPRLRPEPSWGLARGALGWHPRPRSLPPMALAVRVFVGAGGEALWSLG